MGEAADAADDWIAEHIAAHDVCVTSDIPLASRCLAQARGSSRRTARSGRRPISVTAGRPRAVAPSARARGGDRRAGAARPAGPLTVSVGARHRRAAGAARGGHGLAGGSLDPAVEYRVVDHQHDNRADDRHKHAPQVEPGNPRSAQRAEHKPADKRADDAEHDVEEKARAAAVDDLARDQPRSAPKDPPKDKTSHSFYGQSPADSLRQPNGPRHDATRPSG